MDLPTFRTQFPEFINVPDATVTAMLNGAALQLDTGIWAEKYDQGHGYLTAHMLVMSPYGQNARMVVRGEETSTYFGIYQRMVTIVASGRFRCL